MTTMAELRSHRFLKEQELTAIAHRIEGRLGGYRDWRSQVQHHPWATVGLAFGLGWLWGQGALRGFIGLGLNIGKVAALVAVLRRWRA